MLDDTIVIVTSDHGEQFGEHDLVYHSNSLYKPLLHVPLIVVWPDRIPAAREVADFVSLRDLPATVTDLLDLDDSPFPGQSWASTWAPDDGPRPPTHLAEILIGDRVPSWLSPTWPVSKGGMRAANEHGMHLIRRGDGQEELYDLKNDPHERTNLVDDKAHAAVLQKLRGWLDDL